MKIDFQKIKKTLFPRKFAKSEEDLPFWYKFLVPYDGILPLRIISKKVILMDGSERTMETKVYKKRIVSRIID